VGCILGNNGLKYYQLRRFNSDIHVFEFSPELYPSQISKGVANQLERLSEIKHTWFEQNGYEPIAKINFGFFNPAEHYGWLFRDSGTSEGDPTTVPAIECYLTKDNRFVVEDLTLDKIKSIKGNIRWGGSLSYSLVINGKENITKREKYEHSGSDNPRTLIGQKSDKTMILAVVDGRSKTNAGLTAHESALLMLELGAYNAINADGGGSSEMILKTSKGLSIMNKPSDGIERKIGSALIVFAPKKDNVFVEMPTPQKTVLDVINHIQLTPNFSLHEFECHDGNHQVKLHPELLQKLQQLRELVAKPIRINSGYRTVEYNAKIGGSPHSQHLLGKATDLAVPQGLTIDQFANLALKVGFNGIGKYPWGIHVDVRETPARWDFR